MECIAAGSLLAVYYVTSKKYETPNNFRIRNPSEFPGTKENCRILPQNKIFFFFCGAYSLDRNQTSALNRDDIGKNYILGSLIRIK